MWSLAFWILAASELLPVPASLHPLPDAHPHLLESISFYNLCLQVLAFLSLCTHTLPYLLSVPPTCSVLVSCLNLILLLKNEQRRVKPRHCDIQKKSLQHLQLLKHMIGKKWASNTNSTPNALGLQSVEGKATSFTNKSFIGFKYPLWLENQKRVWCLLRSRDCNVLFCYFQISQNGQLVWEDNAWRKATLKPGRVFYNSYLIHCVRRVYAPGFCLVHNKGLESPTLKPPRHVTALGSWTDRVIALRSQTDRVIALRQISVTPLCYSSILFR